jgi:hypothetical protein
MSDNQPAPSAQKRGNEKKFELNKYTIWLFLALVLAAGAFLRLWQINTLGYNSDEAVYAGQGAAIAEVPILTEIFPIFRAHPLLFQFLLGIVFRVSFSDLLGRLVAVVIGLTTLIVVYHLGKTLYGPKSGIIAALFMALMPYHVVVTRQVLLDGPLVLFATLTLYLMARFAGSLAEMEGYSRKPNPTWLYAVGAGMGLTFLAKETGVVLLGSIYAFLALSDELRIRIRDLVIAFACMVLIIAPFPISLNLAGGGGGGTTGQYIIWQLFRRPNHVWSFYPTTVPFAIGPLLILVALAGLWFWRKEYSWRERLLLAWIVIPVVFFQLWPVKGFQYLLPTAPAFALLASAALVRWHDSRRSQLAWLMTAIVAFSLFFTSWQRVQIVDRDEFLAGSGGVPGGREMGHWIDENVPEGAVFMTVGPSMGNIVQFYGHRIAYGLSVSPNPLHRNPSYKAIENPDLQLRNGNLQYIIWDSFSASRSIFFSEKLLQYAERYHGRVVHTESVTMTTDEGEEVVKPVIIIYEVRP